MAPELTVVEDNGRIHGDLDFSCAIVDPLPRFPGYHTHRGFLEMVLVLRGPLWHHINGHRRRVDRGTLLLIRESDRHFFERALGHQGGFINIAFTPSTFEDVLRFVVGDSTDESLYMAIEPPETSLSEDQVTLVENAVRRVIGIKESAEQRMVLRGMMAPLVVSLLQSESVLSGRSYPRWLRCLLRRIDSDPVAKSDVKALAEAAGRSPEHLSRTFRRYLGMTPSRFLMERRLSYACDLLTHSEIPIHEVAGAAGFGNRSYFHNQFKAKYGATPRSFRREHEQRYLAHLPQEIRRRIRGADSERDRAPSRLGRELD